MKQFLIVTFVAALAVNAQAQENMVTLSGGYSFANVEESETSASGWRINGLYEFNPKEGILSHGISLGYIHTSASAESVQGEPVDYKISTLPIYYAPKLIFGKGSAKIFVKGALGWQHSWFNRTGQAIVTETNDGGFYGGASAGFMKIFNERYFLSAEYEWAYMSNSYYRDGFMNSVMAGLGIKF